MSDTETGCVVPVLQSAVVGLLAGLVALAVVMLKDWSAWYALGAGALSALLTFISGVSVWRRSQYEDVFYSPPPPGPDRVRVEMVKSGDGPSRQTQFTDLPASYDQLRTLADGVMRGAPLSENTWCGPGKLFTRAEFGALRAELLRRGWCSWRRADSPGQGVTVTSQGRAVLRSFASETVRPLPYPLTQGGDD